MRYCSGLIRSVAAVILFDYSVDRLQSDPLIHIDLWPWRVEMVHIIVINWWNVNSAHCPHSRLYVGLNTGPLASAIWPLSLSALSHVYFICSLTCRWSGGFPSRPAPVDSWPCSLPVEAGSWRNLWTRFHISQPLGPPAADRLEHEKWAYISY